MIALTVTNGGVELAVEVRGNGRPIVLVHGHGTNLLSWRPLADRLEGDYTIVSYDRRGHCRSASADTFTAGDFTSDLRAVVRAVGLGDPLLIGHSVGAWEVLRYAASKPAAGVICLDHAIATRDPFWPTVYGGRPDNAARSIEAGWVTVGDEPYDDIRCPTVVMLAERNTGPVHDMLCRLVDRRGLRAVHVDSDHDIHVERPELVVRLVHEMLAR